MTKVTSEFLELQNNDKWLTEKIKFSDKKVKELTTKLSLYSEDYQKYIKLKKENNIKMANYKHEEIVK